jgi:hypothetical protein
MVTGFTTMPDSNFLTWATWAACASGSRLRWITPMPPACAMAIASFASVTVSMAEEMTGTLSEIERVTRDETSASFGNTLEAAGLIRTSSKVNATAPSANCLLSSGVCPVGIGQPFVRGRALALALQQGTTGWRPPLAVCGGFGKAGEPGHLTLCVLTLAASAVAANNQPNR